MQNIAGAKRYSRPRGFNIAGASAPVAPAVPTPLLQSYQPRAQSVPFDDDDGLFTDTSEHIRFFSLLLLFSTVSIPLCRLILLM